MALPAAAMFSGLFRSRAPQARGPRPPPRQAAGAPVRQGLSYKEAKKLARQRAEEEEEEEGQAEPLGKKSRRGKRCKAGSVIEGSEGERAELAADGKAGPKKKKKKKKAETGPAATAAETRQAAPAAPQSLLLSAAAGAGSGTLQGRAAERLKGSRFRWLNDLLYNSTGAEAKKVFDEDPSLAVAYHDGYEAQRQKWPVDPLDNVIAWLRKKIPPSSVIGDFGCGEARLALELKGRKVHSFDLNPVNERITPCNLAEVPLESCSLDVAVFCLALMGTDWPSFLKEAHRCLRPGGLCHIAEVESRFEDIQDVIASVEAIGFRQVHERPGEFFMELRFKKVKASAAGQLRGKRKWKGGDGDDGLAGGAAALQACNYRRR